MSDPREQLQQALDSRDYDLVDEAWLELATDQPADLDPFFRAADILDRQGEEDRAVALLDLLDEQLCEQELWGERLELLQRAGSRYLRTGHIHETVLESIERNWADRADDLAIVMKAVGLDRSKDETPKLWDKVDRLRNLLTYEKGIIVAMEGKGVGRVAEVNLALKTLKVDFEQHKGLAVGFRAAGKMLELLTPDHVLYRKVEQPEELEELTPPELLREVLTSWDRPMAAGEVREAVHGVVPTKKWTSWWSAARKHPQVLSSGTGSRQTYRWAESTEDAEAELLTALRRADTRGKIDLLKRISQQDSSVQGQAIEMLERHARSLAQRDLAQALEIWIAIERIGEPSFDPRPLLAAATDVDRVLSRLSSRAVRERTLELVQSVRSDWQEIFADRFLVASHPLTQSMIVDRLKEADVEVENLFDRTMAQPSRAPAAFTWLAERAAEDSALRERYGLRLLKQIVWSLGDPTFANLRARLEHAVETGGAVPKLISNLDTESAEEAEEVIRRARGLEEYQREPLLTALYIKHPELEKQETAGQPLYTTAAALAAKREDLRELLEEEIPANRRAIEEARAMGDLRENFEYKSARQRHEYLSARATELNQQLERARVIEIPAETPSDVRIGTVVVLEPATGTGDSRRLTILGPWESAPEDDVISYESDLARKLVGKRIDDEVEIDGESLRIAAIETADIDC